MSFVFHIILKSTLLLVVIKLVLLLIKKNQYSLRHLLISWGMLGLLSLPFLIVFAPSIRMTLPALAQQEVQLLQKESKRTTQQTKEYIAVKNVLPPARNLSNDQKVISYGKSVQSIPCLLYTSPSPRDATLSRMPSSA